jgi:hypothetical protein
MPDEAAKPNAAVSALKSSGSLEKFIKIEKIEKTEHKEKPEKIEHKEKPEKWEHKEKPEKFEHKEKPEKFEHKEKFEVKEKFEIKELENKQILEQLPSPETGDPEQRLAALEAQVAALTHFITTGQRPDVSHGALANEPAAKK